MAAAAAPAHAPAAAPAAASDAPAAADAPGTDASSSLGGAKRKTVKDRASAEEKLAAFKRALLHPYGTLVSNVNCAQVCEDLQVAMTGLSRTTATRFLSALLAHQRELPRAARLATSRKDFAGTLAKYKARLVEKIPDAEFARLDGAWLSHYRVSGFIPVADLEQAGFVPPIGAEEAYVVYQVARLKGFAPLGIVSEKGKKLDKSDASNKTRVHLCEVPGPRVYVGPAMTMWNLEKSVFRTDAEDTVLHPKKGRAPGSKATAAAGSTAATAAPDAAVAPADASSPS